MSATGYILHLRLPNHFHGRKSYLQTECPRLNTKVPRFYCPEDCDTVSGLRLPNVKYHRRSSGISRLLLIGKCAASDNLSPEWPSEHASNCPKVVMFRYYAPALGFLMFAVGVNSSEKDFLEAFRKPGAIFAGYVGQFVVKPFLGYLFGTLAMTLLGLPTSLAVGIMLTSCVSGAQLSNYATFLTDPQMAPLSIVMTSISTATAVFVTPLLSLLLIGKKLPVDVKGMVSNILQIVVTPIATGLLLNRFFPKICNAIRPLLPPLSVFVTALCVGAPLAINVESVMSPSGISVLLLVIAFHLSAFVAGYFLTGFIFHNSPDVDALQRTLSYETGMQSSLLALALANRFFQDPLVSIPPAISTVMMSLMGFALVLLWARKEKNGA
ncbi:probable sodium/metabolite cotransporter BASS5, chloroplastic isoform X2 [Andrographis paniculata]|uniref:probable sodium/metabolite cotransporter BASS5, chloroplastic isoform X2 n=1 Tax=Andrographis paniculata TaxID=175694 RepID=UPI0021E86CA5|nr:probable sodium/metabolite cotransporter BASS5, chloroplastic isoform X2 [Andrographis paniculata]